MSGLLNGSLILASYALPVWVIVWYFSKFNKNTKSYFLTADRQLNSWEASFSIAATWIWAPALFVAASKAYTQGWIGLFWFTVPNFFCLILFAHFAERVRNQLPEGYTISDFIKSKTSNRVQYIYNTELIGLSLCSFAVQLLAAGKVVSFLTGFPFFGVIVFLSILALSYSLVSGIKGSVVTDYLQMIIILAVCACCVPAVIMEAGGFSSIVSGLAGKSGEFTSFFGDAGMNVFMTFGIPVTIGLMAGPFGDQSFWQRTFSIKEGQVKSAFVKGAFIFVTVPLMLSVLGFIAAGSEIEIKDPSLVNVETIIHFLPAWVILPFTFMLLSGLVSTLDSCLCSVSSILGHDISEKLGSTNPLRIAKYGMIAVCLIGMLIACIPGMKIVYLFLFYGTLRASVLIPTMITILSDRINESSIFWGIFLAILIGLPMFAFGQFGGHQNIKLAGSLITVLTPGIFYLNSKFNNRRI